MVGDVRRRASGQVAKFHTPEIVLGPGAFGEVPVATAGLGMRRPFVVSDRCLERTPWYAQLMAGLRAGGLDAASYLDVSPNHGPARSRRRSSPTRHTMPTASSPWAAVR